MNCPHSTFFGMLSKALGEEAIRLKKPQLRGLGLLLFFLRRAGSLGEFGGIESQLLVGVRTPSDKGSIWWKEPELEKNPLSCDIGRLKEASDSERGVRPSLEGRGGFWMMMKPKLRSSVFSVIQSCWKCVGVVKCERFGYRPYKMMLRDASDMHKNELFAGFIILKGSFASIFSYPYNRLITKLIC